MRITALFLASVFFPGMILAQVQLDLDINNIKARINPDGSLFWDKENQKFEVPKGSGIHAMFAGGLWIGGMDEYGLLHMAAQTYNQTGYDFFRGPIMREPYPDVLQDGNPWLSAWKVNRSTVDSFAAGLLIMPPESFLDWPAHGDTSFGQAQNLAPFHDVNGNGVYEPAAGDYPAIRGDQAVYFLFNDSNGVHTESGGAKLGIEVHGMAYAFYCNHADFDNTIFLHYDIINRSEHTYENTILGLWLDFDLGYAYDDYVGSDSLLNLFFAYNGDDYDGTSSGQHGYGVRPPAIGAVCLNDNMGSAMFYDGDFSNHSEPYSAEHFYTYLQSKWKDGSPYQFGKYMFPGDPATETQWTEEAQGNVPSDRRGVAGYTPFTFFPGETKSYDFAIVFARAETGNNLSSVTRLKDRVTLIQRAYDEGVSPCGQPFIPEKQEEEPTESFYLFPNPAKQTIYYRYDSDSIMQSVRIFDVFGRLHKTFREDERKKGSADISGLPAGIYLMEFRNNVKSRVFKVIKFGEEEK